MNSRGPTTGAKSSSCCPFFIIIMPLSATAFSSSIAFQMGHRIAQWATGMSALSHFSLYSAKCWCIWKWQDELPPLRSAFLLPFNFTNFSLFLYHGKQCCWSHFTINYLLADIAPSSCFCLILVIPNLELHHHFVQHYHKKILCQIFFHRFFLELFTTLVLVKTIILWLCESMPCHWGFVLTSLPGLSSTSLTSFPGLVVSSTLSTSSSDSTITLRGCLCLFAFALGVGSSNSDPSGSLSSSLLSLACLLQLFCFLGFGGKWDLWAIPFAMVQVTVGMVVLFKEWTMAMLGCIGCLLQLFCHLVIQNRNQ